MILKGKTAIVTGASRGIGREIAIAVDIISRAMLIPIVIASAKREELMSLSSEL